MRLAKMLAKRVLALVVILSYGSQAQQTTTMMVMDDNSPLIVNETANTSHGGAI
jgi:hypothetical protein